MMLITLVCCVALGAAFPLSQDPQELPTNDVDNEMDPDQLADYLRSLLSEEEEDLPLVYLPPVEKRSRYYRRYPWKRQNGHNYDPDGYLCTPTRQDVFQLLIALHEARSGNTDKTVNFCNRRRPARAVFTNIRFLGRR